MTGPVPASEIHRLRDTLALVRTKAGPDFSGLGVILYESLESLPVIPLRTTAPLHHGEDLSQYLASISVYRSEYHDGFHLISKRWQLTHVAQYFSPPIVTNARIDRTKQFGGRYLAALFGSALPNVTLCGIVSNGFGLAVFCRGEEVHFEP
jgi:hypothetical protein